MKPPFPPQLLGKKGAHNLDKRCEGEGVIWKSKKKKKKGGGGGAIYFYTPPPLSLNHRRDNNIFIS